MACGSLPGSSRFSPSSVAIDQLLCLPDPLMPANGFSWMRKRQAVLRGEPAHRLHDDHVVVRADRRRLEHRGHLELGRGDLVVAGLGRDAQPPQLAIEIHHERQDPLADRAEVLVLELLALGRRGPEQGPSGEQQVGPLLGQPAVDEEVLLLRTDRREHALGSIVAEPAQHAQGLLAERLLRAQERDLVVERLTRVRHVGRRDGQGHAVGLDLQEDRRGDVPGGVAACLEGRPDAARREGAGVRLALDEGLARELGDDLAIRRSGTGTSRASRRSSPVMGTNQWV